MPRGSTKGLLQYYNKSRTSLPSSNYHCLAMSSAAKSEAPQQKEQQQCAPTHLLHLAVLEGNVEVARFLLKHGVCPNGRATAKQLSLQKFPTDDEHRSHLHWRLGVGADVAVAEALEGKSCAPIHLLARFATANAAEPWTKLIELLLEYGADVNAPMDGGETALLLAVLAGADELVELLLRRGADASARTAWGRSLLHYAVRCRRRRAVDLLLDGGARVNAVDADGKTALHAAADVGSCEMVEVLMKRGADAVLKAKNGATALHYAAIRGNTDVVGVMVEYGADIGMILKNGAIDLSPFKVVTQAEERKTMEVVAKYSTKTRLVNWYNTVVSKFRGGSKSKDRKQLFCAEAE